jgi:hypothetical protein
MFKKANEISGINTETLPTELIPLNTIQLARGLLNFTLLQTLRDWVLPFWAERQYDPASPAFIPRSHLGLSMNLTYRNWTAVGNMECSVEPIVDPRGLVTPLRDGWSLDVWLEVNGVIHFPSKSATVRQRLVNDCPIVETRFVFDGVELTVTTFVVKTELVHRATIRNASTATKNCTIYFAVRPFNPEGIALIHDIKYVHSDAILVVDHGTRIRVGGSPKIVCCSNHEQGDCSRRLLQSESTVAAEHIHCNVGLANAAVGFAAELPSRSSETFETTCVLQEPAILWTRSNGVDPVESWEALLQKGMQLASPDPRMNSLFKSSLTTLLLLIDKESITPGPFTYHQFWFRDAAYMIRALDVAGYAQFTEPLIRAFPSKQMSSGYFRSQQGEWDSNGQVLWTVWQHARVANNYSVVEQLFDSLRRGATWIRNKRIASTSDRDKPYYGLMPRGLSAEHLGLADYYFWDNLWSLAGLEAYAAMCKQLQKMKEGEQVAELAQEYRCDIERAIQWSQRKFGTQAITAGPLRGVDCGMIGSVCAWYPMQLLPMDDSRLLPSLEELTKRFFVSDMFFQDFIHSGMNVYLTLHIAHTWLYLGNREEFWRLLSAVSSCASPTMNFPEAVHPATCGGCMGDGHHGWAAAEIVLALRDAFVFERRVEGSSELVALGGLPASWFGTGESFAIERTPVLGGMISIFVHAYETSVEVRIRYEITSGSIPNRITVALPVVARRVKSEGREMLSHLVNSGETLVNVKPTSQLIVFEK